MAHQHRMIERDTEREPQIVETGIGFFLSEPMHAAQREVCCQFRDLRYGDRDWCNFVTNIIGTKHRLTKDTLIKKGGG
nr:uncharacterized protein LOC112033489 isoform X2 [Quercus suber]